MAAMRLDLPVPGGPYSRWSSRFLKRSSGESCLTLLPWHPSLIRNCTTFCPRSCARQVSWKLISFLERCTRRRFRSWRPADSSPSKLVLRSVSFCSVLPLKFHPHADGRRKTG